MRNYAQAIEYLTDFVNYERQRPAVYSPESLNLDRMRDLLGRLGDPHRAYATIHVAGTKGKGSTAAMIESIARAAGYRTGLYISPHLHTFRERMRVDAELISRETFAEIVDAIAPQVEAVAGITWFEIVTAIGFLHFARAGVEWGVFEVGLGGRFDATNVLTPRVAVITSLSMDHMSWLGDTLEQIAFEKAGIIKPGAPIVSALQQPEAMAVIERIAAERGAPLVVVGRDVTFERLDSSLDGQTFEVRAADRSASVFRIPLLGEHQIVNAAVAVTAIRQAKGIDIGDEAIARGLAAVRWPGRFEIARRDPPLIFDGAHNVDSARRLAEALDGVFPNRRWTLVFGASADKEIDKMLDALASRCDRLIVTCARNVRAADLERIAQIAAGKHLSVETIPSVVDALARALDTGDPATITGSLFVVAEAREAWFARLGRPIVDRDE